MKTQIKKRTTNKSIEKKSITAKNIDKTKALKWVIIGFGIAVFALWISWFTCDCIFVAKGIEITSLPSPGSVTEIGWQWAQKWYKIQETQLIVLLAMLGGYMGLLFSYMVICGLNVKNNIQKNVYQLIAIGAGLICILICIAKSTQMVINQKYVIDILVEVDWTEALAPKITSASFNVYHTVFLRWLSIPPASVAFTTTLLILSFRKFGKETFIKDSNILILVFSAVMVLLFVPFVIEFGYNDPAAVIDLTQGLVIVNDPLTWKHITAQLITSPMEIFAGMLMIFAVWRIVCVIFAYNNRWHEKKQHLIIFGVITFFVIAGFIVAHVSPQDFEKLIFDYKSMKLGGLLVVTAEAGMTVPAGIYCLLSMIRYNKERAI